MRRLCILSFLSFGIYVLVFVLGVIGGSPIAFASGSIYYVEPNGNDSTIGSLSNPWKSLSHSIPKLKAGDVLYLREGIYFENKVRPSVSGTASQPITIKNYPGETPIVDGGYEEFRIVPNNDWEVYDAKKNIYRSVKTYPESEKVHAYLDLDGSKYHLVSYEDYNDLISNNEAYTDTGSIYIGPGVFWNDGDDKIYIRLQHSQQEKEMGYNIPANIDPRQNIIYMVPAGTLLKFSNGASYIDIEGVDFRFRNYAVEFKSVSHHITIKDSNILGGRYHVLIRDGAHDLVFDDIRIYDCIPDWVAWTDVKCGTNPGHQFQGAGISFDESPYNIEIKNSVFINTWDGITATGSAHHIRIHDNDFKGTRDDVLHLGSGCYDVEVYHNKMQYVFSGVSWHGSGSPKKMGTKYIHHNIIDCSKPMLGGRYDPNLLLDSKRRGMACSRPFGAHAGSGYGAGDPRKIYHNTVIFRKDWDNQGAGHSYKIRAFDASCPHEVYNNIFIQMADHWLAREVRVADGSQIHDGNIYFRVVSDPEKPFFLSWMSGEKRSHFNTVSEFKAAQFFVDSKISYPSGLEKSGIEINPQLDSKYYPQSGSPAVSGAIPLPLDWPGQDGGKYRGALHPKLTSPQTLRIIREFIHNILPK